MRVQKKGVLCLVGWCMLLWAGCCKEQDGLPCVSGVIKNGDGCFRDDNCKSGFCDRGTCGHPEPGYWNYGGACEPGHPPHPGEETRFPANGDVCDGFICVNRRCSSCVSDAECQVGWKDYKCLPYEQLPGILRCGDPNEARRNLGAPQPGFTHYIDPKDVVISIPPRMDNTPRKPPPRQPR